MPTICGLIIPSLCVLVILEKVRIQIIPPFPFQSPDEARDFHMKVLKVSDKTLLFGMHGVGLEDKE